PRGSKCRYPGSETTAGSCRDERLARYRLRSVGPTGAGIGLCWRELSLLSELVDAALEELLIGTQICELVGAGRRKTSEQRNCSSQAADRRHAADIPLSNHCSPEKSKVAISRTRSPGRFSRLIWTRGCLASTLCQLRGVFVAAWRCCNIFIYRIEYT